MITIRDIEAQGRPLRRVAAGLLLASSLSALGQAAVAQDLVYTPINPSFGGSPLNSSHLLSIANAQRSATARDAETNDGLSGTGIDTPSTSNADLFVRPQDGGLVTFGTTTVEFQRTLDSIRLVIIDSLDGTVTEIVVPQLVTAG